jgi:hypothetical protein
MDVGRIPTLEKQASLPSRPDQSAELEICSREYADRSRYRTVSGVKGSLRFCGSANIPVNLKANDRTRAVKIALDRGFFEI